MVKWRTLMRRLTKELGPYEEVYSPEVRNGHSRVYYRVRDAADSRVALWIWRGAVALGLVAVVVVGTMIVSRLNTLTATQAVQSNGGK